MKEANINNFHDVPSNNHCIQTVNIRKMKFLDIINRDSTRSWPQF